ncbi:hypothetical protein Moror_12089 [Moniliophthora roreri MCA 2997]|uniref:Uncharacterized protein n=2 Tax=Moniliophthora roreri TaxID=221103 RepID=V2W9T0_MONRO|nr:hypothetical protein Moror_12089 [Moniliophthora roreri MCA 2997]
MNASLPSTSHSYHTASADKTMTLSKSTHSYTCDSLPPSVEDGHFAFARIGGEVRLVQVSSSTPIGALTTIDVKIFRHEFITIFRLLETKTIHPADIYILETIDDRSKCYEEEKEMVFLSKDVVERMRKLSLPVFARPYPYRPSRRIYYTLR